MDNDQIAARLYISRNTVKFHVRTIYERLGVHNRVEAARGCSPAPASSPRPEAGPPKGGPAMLPAG